MNALLISILIYILLIVCLYSFKPRICFKRDGKMKSFGIGKNKTPFTFLTISIILGIFSLVLAIIYQDYITPSVNEVLQEARDIAKQTTGILNNIN